MNATSKWVLGSVIAALVIVIAGQHHTIQSLRWDKTELQLTVDELYAEQEWAEQCCNAQGEGCGEPIYGSDC